MCRETIDRRDVACEVILGILAAAGLKERAPLVVVLNSARCMAVMMQFHVRSMSAQISLNSRSTKEHDSKGDVTAK